MNIVKKDNNAFADHELAYYDPTEPFTEETAENPLKPILSRWYVVLLTMFVCCILGIPAVWYLVKTEYIATGAIHIAPVIHSIMFRDSESDGVLPMYRNYVNTQAELLTSDPILRRVLDNLNDKNLPMFQDTPEQKQLAKLRLAIINDRIKILTDRHSELIKIRMQDRNADQAGTIVNEFIQAYMNLQALKESDKSKSKIRKLESEQKVYANKIEQKRQIIRQLSEEYGTSNLDSRQSMMLNRVAGIQSKLTDIQTQILGLETRYEIFEQRDSNSTSPDRILKLKNDYINSNPTIQVLTHNIAQLDQQLILAEQQLAPTNPELLQKQNLLKALRERYHEKEQELTGEFEVMIKEQTSQKHLQELVDIEMQIAELENYEKRLLELLQQENEQTIELGRKQLAIEDQQQQLALSQQLYDEVSRKIMELELEQKRPARISVAYEANIRPARNKRVKFSGAVIFGSFALGSFIAFLLGKTDYSIYTPEDIRKKVGVRIIGTTTNAATLSRPQLPQQIANDYQTIRANLGLLNEGQIPQRIVITSPGVREGKTTFSINFASSLGQAGKKVLLIDGDLRKPDVRSKLEINKSLRGFQDVLLGRAFKEVVYQDPRFHFDILASDSRNMTDAFELLSQSHVIDCIKQISQNYDHVILDTPPVLAFPDAMILARLSDGVLLTTFSGQTEDRDLKEAVNRLEQIHIPILGTILNSVQTSVSYNRYGYSYYTGQKRPSRRRRRQVRSTLLAPVDPDDSQEASTIMSDENSN